MSVLAGKAAALDDRLGALQALERRGGFADLGPKLSLTPDETAFLERSMALPEDPGEAARAFASLVEEKPEAYAALWNLPAAATEGR